MNSLNDIFIYLSWTYEAFDLRNIQYLRKLLASHVKNLKESVVVNT